jgi:plastocyanin
MKRIILTVVLFSVATIGFSTTVTVTNSGFEFSPGALTINLGDDVLFNIASIHDVVEVSLATYNANGTTPLPGGFSLPLGGGTVPANLLTAGIHYYVCGQHASSGMKGTITVQSSAGIAEDLLKDGFSIFPNPSNGNFQLKINNQQPAKRFDLGIYDAIGNKVYAKSDIQKQFATNVEISDLPKGTYVVRLYDGRESYYRKILVR